MNPYEVENEFTSFILGPSSGRKQNDMTEQERMQSIMLTHDQIEEIASRAADKAIDRITHYLYVKDS